MSPSTTLRTATAVMLAVTLAACQGGPRRTLQVAAAPVPGTTPVRSGPVAVATPPSARSAVEKPAAGKSAAAEPAPRVVTREGAAKAQARAYTVDGFNVYEGEGGRLWVFRTGSEDLASFLTKGEPAKRVTLIGEGPDGVTLMGSDADAMKAYAATVKYALPGYAVHGAEEGRLWVFRAGSSHHATFKAKGEPAKRVTLIGQGPDGRTLLGSDTAVMKDFADSWRFAAPGFAVIADDGRLWVFRQGGEHHETFKTKGEPAKRITLIGRGPDGRTLLGAEKATLEDYVRAMGAQ